MGITNLLRHPLCRHRSVPMTPGWTASEVWPPLQQSGVQPPREQDVGQLRLCVSIPGRVLPALGKVQVIQVHSLHQLVCRGEEGDDPAAVFVAGSSF
eukprot:760334-Hanusia_phi.AAC.2